MDNTPEAITKRVEARMNHSFTPSQTGLDALHDEYATCTTNSPADCNKTMKQVFKELNHDDELGPIYAWGENRIKDHGIPSPDYGKVLMFGDVKSVANVDGDFWRGAKDVPAEPNKDQFERFAAQQMMNVGPWGRDLAEDYLKSKIDYADRARKAAYGVELLNTPGGEKRLWQKLEDVDPTHHRIQLDDLKTAMESPGSIQLTGDQQKAATELIDHWGDLADLKGVDDEDEFEPFNPVHSPFYGMNPINRIKPWNYVNKHIGMGETITADTTRLRYPELQLKNDHPDDR
jgi:hypothetical protein